jgi:acetyl esterase/lipase
VARAQYEARITLMAPAAEIANVREQTIDGLGGPLRICIYTPAATSPFPLLVFFHGSGFVLCNLDTHDAMCRNPCAGAEWRRGKLPEIGTADRTPLQRGARKRAFVGQALAA